MTRLGNFIASSVVRSVGDCDQPCRPVSWRSESQAAAEDLIRPAIRGFVDTIPDVESVVEGRSSSPEGLEDGFDYGFVVTFASSRARDAYLDDPVHRPVAEGLRRLQAHRCLRH